MSHLGALPGQLDLSARDKRELLSYSRTKSASQDICPTCIDQMKKASKTCFVCDKDYTDEDEPELTAEDVHEQNARNAMLLGQMSGDEGAKREAAEDLIARMMEASSGDSKG